MDLKAALAEALRKRAWKLADLAKHFEVPESSIRGRVCEMREAGTVVMGWKAEGEQWYVLPEGLAPKAGSPSDYKGLAKYLKGEFRTLADIASKWAVSQPAAALMVEEAKKAGLDVQTFNVGATRFYTITSNSKDPRQGLEFKAPAMKEGKVSVYRFGVVSDSHLGNKHSMIADLHRAYDVFQGMGIKTVIHAGDVTDGDGRVFKGQMQEMTIPPTPEASALEVIKNYPRRPGITTAFIVGNHDMAHSRSGIDFAKYLQMRLAEAGRDDMMYLGDQYGIVRFSDGINELRVDVSHPSGMGTASLSGFIKRYYNKDNLPHMLLMGHFHHYSEEIVQGVYGMTLPCLQAYRSFLSTAAWNDTPGFVVVDLVVKGGKIIRKTVEFLPADGGVPR